MKTIMAMVITLILDITLIFVLIFGGWLIGYCCNAGATEAIAATYATTIGGMSEQEYIVGKFIGDITKALG